MSVGHYQIEEFTYSKAPTGQDILELIKDNELQAYEFESIKSNIVHNMNYSTGFQNTVWTVTFRRKK